MRRLLLALVLLTPFIGHATQSHAARYVHPVLKHRTDLVPAHIHVKDVLRASHLTGAIDNLYVYAPAPRDQEQTGSCESYATTSLRWWYAKRDLGATTPSVFAAMYQYAQISKGVDGGSGFDNNFAIQQSQGAEPENEYSYGLSAARWDFTDQPTTADHAAAAPYTITGWHYIISGPAPDNAAIIDAELRAGHPVNIAIGVYPEWEFYQGGVIGPHTAGETLFGYHGIDLYGEDAQGNFVGDNQWSNWGETGPTGQPGWFKVSPEFVNRELIGAAVIDGVHDPQPGPVPTATPIPTSIPTATPTETPTAVPTDIPTVTPPPPPTAIPAHCKEWGPMTPEILVINGRRRHAQYQICVWWKS